VRPAGGAVQAPTRYGGDIALRVCAGKTGPQGSSDVTPARLEHAGRANQRVQTVEVEHPFAPRRGAAASLQACV